MDSSVCSAEMFMKDARMFVLLEEPFGSGYVQDSATNLLKPWREIRHNFAVFEKRKS
jgi:hypothetical protein